MKKIVLMSLLLIALHTAAALATTYNFSTSQLSSSDQALITSMDHSQNVIWMLRQNIGLDTTITKASLVISNLYDWERNAADLLYVHLLNTTYGNNILRTSTDSDDTHDYFSNQGFLLATASGETYYPGAAKTLTIDFSKEALAALATDVKDGYFAFAFDPDCHWYDSGMMFSFDTETVPEPSSLLLLGAGIIGAAVFFRKKRV